MRRMHGNDVWRERAIGIAMLLNAVLVALALSAAACSDPRAPVSSDGNWKSPHNQPPAFEPFLHVEAFWRPSV